MRNLESFRWFRDGGTGRAKECCRERERDSYGRDDLGLDFGMGRKSKRGFKAGWRYHSSERAGTIWDLTASPLKKGLVGARSKLLVLVEVKRSGLLKGLLPVSGSRQSPLSAHHPGPRLRPQLSGAARADLPSHEL